VTVATALHTLKLPRLFSSLSSQLVCVQRLMLRLDPDDGPFWSVARRRRVEMFSDMPTGSGCRLGALMPSIRVYWVHMYTA